jgi:hypothetical protein
VTPLGSDHYENRPQRGRTFIGFVPPGTKRINKTFCAARDKKDQYNILCRQGPKGSIKHFVPPGTKKINITFYAARDQKDQYNILCRQGPKESI